MSFWLLCQWLNGIVSWSHTHTFNRFLISIHFYSYTCTKFSIHHCSFGAIFIYIYQFLSTEKENVNPRYHLIDQWYYTVLTVSNETSIFCSFLLWWDNTPTKTESQIKNGLVDMNQIPSILVRQRSQQSIEVSQQLQLDEKNC